MYKLTRNREYSAAGGERSESNKTRKRENKKRAQNTRSGVLAVHVN
jgi:hypothetical protein